MQISCAATATLISAFVFTTQTVQFLLFLNPKVQASSHLLKLHRPVCVIPGPKPQRPVFSRCGSIKPAPFTTRPQGPPLPLGRRGHLNHLATVAAFTTWPQGPPLPLSCRGRLYHLVAGATLTTRPQWPPLPLGHRGHLCHSAAGAAFTTWPQGPP